MTLVVTGADGFLGWHTRVLAHARGLAPVVGVCRGGDLDGVDGADRVVHIAGVNRGGPAEIAGGNLGAAEVLAAAIGRAAAPPRTVVYANSAQAGNGTPYGDAKAAAGAVLADAAARAGSRFVDVTLPNLFGEHGRPFYNSVVATFAHLLATGGTPEVHDDRELDLLHVTDAAALLLDPAPGPAPMFRATVSDLAARLTRFAEVYRTGEIPALGGRDDVRLFNTYRSQCFPTHYPMRPARHSDARGELVEAVKVHGGGGQSFVSSTVPGVTRGQHYHLAKVERFLVLRGEAEISLRRLLHDDVVTFRVSGDEPAIVDMPTMWAHNITNTGSGELLTLFWANDLFDAANPDTYPEEV
ncbi:MAG TPA: NAD-dependent epimerase/dehydratase family protein [Mycobacteriales bacterium]|nr:NAD-dependent epimerase/dehydratase family protein [Mycobacteriales bacterium]